MFDHVVFGVSDYGASKAFFLKALEPLGVALVLEGPLGLELSSDGKSSLCICQTAEKPAHLHLAFTAGNRQQVEAFHRAALQAGGKDNGAPGLRPHYHANYYAAFVIGPDGHNIEVVCHEPEQYVSATENKQILQHVFAETAKGNGRPFVDALADDVAWTIIGSTPWSKTYHGKAMVLRELLGPLNSQLTHRNIITAQRFIAEDNHVVVEGQGHNTTKAGGQYNNRYCWVFRFSERRVVELIEYTDTALIESALRPPSV